MNVLWKSVLLIFQETIGVGTPSATHSSSIRPLAMTSWSRGLKVKVGGTEITVTEEPVNLDVSTYSPRTSISVIHSGHFYSAPSSPLLLRGAPGYSTDTVPEFKAEAHRLLQVKDLPKVPPWRLERESNPRPSG